MNESIENIDANITRRIATQEDIDLARAIHHKAYHDVIVKQFGSWNESNENNFFNKTWRPEMFEVILSDESVSGYCSIERKDDQIFVNELVLSPEFQGKGIGSKILNELIEESKQKNIPIKLHVFKENQAQHLYRKLGFKDTVTTDTEFEMVYSPSNNN